MSLPQYQLFVIDATTGSVKAMFDGASFLNFRCNRKLNDIGSIAFSLPGTDDNYSLFNWDDLLEVKRTSPITNQLITEETYLVRSKQIFVEDEQDILVIGGLSLLHLLTRRIIDPEDDPAAVGGYSKKTGPADSVMRGYCREQIGDLASVSRRLTNLTILPVSGVGVSISQSRRYNILFNAIQDISLRSGIDFRIYRTTGTAMEMEIATQGTDRTKASNYPFAQWVGLTPLRRNLSSPSLTIDRSDENNYVYCLGQGQGDERLVMKMGLNADYGPFSRCEYVKDARNVDKTDTTGLLDAAVTSLNEQKVNREFKFSPTNYEPGAVYRKDYDLADSVTVIWKGEEFDLRITEVELNLSAQTESISVSVAELYV